MLNINTSRTIKTYGWKRFLSSSKSSKLSKFQYRYNRKCFMPHIQMSANDTITNHWMCKRWSKIKSYNNNPDIRTILQCHIPFNTLSDKAGYTLSHAFQPHFPILSFCEFYLCGSLKNKIHRTNPKKGNLPKPLVTFTKLLVKNFNMWSFIYPYMLKIQKEISFRICNISNLLLSFF